MNDAVTDRPHVWPQSCTLFKRARTGSVGVGQSSQAGNDLHNPLPLQLRFPTLHTWQLWLLALGSGKAAWLWKAAWYLTRFLVVEVVLDSGKQSVRVVPAPLLEGWKRRSRQRTCAAGVEEGGQAGEVLLHHLMQVALLHLQLPPLHLGLGGRLSCHGQPATLLHGVQTDVARMQTCIPFV